MEEIGLGALSYRLRTEDIATGMTRLKTMMARWEGLGLVTDYVIPDDDETDPQDLESGLLPEAQEAVILNLAKVLAPAFGKQVNPETIKGARAGYQTVLRASTTPPAKGIDITAVPLGAGHKRRSGRTTMVPDDEDTIPDISVGAGNFVVVPE